jgi:hypothetical protein
MHQRPTHPDSARWRRAATLAGFIDLAQPFIYALSVFARRAFCSLSVSFVLIFPLPAVILDSEGISRSRNMAKDAKLGLVLGTGLVIIIAVVFFRKDAASAREQGPAAAAVSATSTLPTISSQSARVSRN